MRLAILVQVLCDKHNVYPTKKKYGDLLRREEGGGGGGGGGVAGPTPVCTEHRRHAPHLLYCSTITQLT